jgi:hypothetical protein
MILKVCNAPIKEILNRHFLQSLHRVSFPGSSLPISKNCDNSLVENEIYDRSNRVEVEFFIGLMLRKGIIKEKFLVVNIFSDSINFITTFMNYD